MKSVRKSIQKRRIFMIAHDAIEDTPEFEAIREELEEKIIAKIGKPCGMGYCYKYWSAKKQILKADYGIDWRSPSELNPHILFD